MDQKNNQVKEIFEVTEDTVDNFDQLNEKYRKNWDWIVFIYNKRKKIKIILTRMN
jgi:hypothetical protein